MRMLGVTDSVLECLLFLPTMTVLNHVGFVLAGVPTTAREHGYQAAHSAAGQAVPQFHCAEVEACCTELPGPTA